MDLFEPVTIRGMELKNRIIMPAMHLNLGFLSKRSVAFYEERAKGGVGCITTAAITPDPFCSDEVFEGRGTVASFLERLRHGVVAVSHKYGAKIGVQLWHGNMYPAGMWGGYNLGADEITGDWVAPSARDKFRALTVKEIREIIEKLAMASANVREAGFDFVDLNLAHGYMPNQFFSPIYNQRDDEYGGDLQRRMRFGTDWVKATREAVGDNYPISVRLGAQEFMQENGIRIEESTEFAAGLVKAGADIISVSVADPFPDICPGPDDPAGTYVPFAEAVKDRVDTIVVGVGKINTREAAEEVLSRGKIDLIGIGRQLIADPHWVIKVSEGRSDEIVGCLSCNKCCEAVTVGQSAVKCKVNRLAGREWEGEIPETDQEKEVVA